MDTIPQASMPEEFNDNHLLVSINASLSSRSFAESLGDHATISSFKMALGSIVADDIELCDELFTSAPIDEPDSEFVIKSFKGTSRKISAQDLSKVWKIKVKDAERTLKVVTQLKKHNVDEHLSREFGTNDRMLRY